MADRHPASPSYSSVYSDSSRRRDSVDICDRPDPFHPPPPSRQRWTQVLALVTACMLSLGSHYGTYLLGPLKTSLSRELGSDNVQFSILIGSFSLNNTWTPLVGGLITSMMGTAVSSILATSLIFLGQALLLFGRWQGHLATMAWGCFLFGLGTSPLAVVQETIICRFFDRKGLGISLALGLVAGKGASFLSSIVSLPLAQRFGPTAPFVVSTSIASMSFLVNIFYLLAGRWLARNAGVPQEDDPDSDDDLEEALDTRDDDFDMSITPSHPRPSGRSRSAVSEEAPPYIPLPARRISFYDLSKLGDPFWIYMTLNFLCGMIWYPFLHLAANLVQQRYQLSDSVAAKDASILLAGPLVLYPLVGSIVDTFSARPLMSHEHPENISELDGMTPNYVLEEQAVLDVARTGRRRAKIVHLLFIISSLLTMGCFLWLVFPASLTRTPVPGLVSWGIGHGFSTLLLVLVVPGIVAAKYIPLALGAHKSIEMAGSTLSSTLAGWLLDTKPKVDTPKSAKEDIPLSRSSTWFTLFGFLLANLVQLALVIWLRQADMHRYSDEGEDQTRYKSLPVRIAADEDSVLGDTSPLLDHHHQMRRTSSVCRRGSMISHHHRSFSALANRDSSEGRRGRFFLIAYISCVLLVWIIFAWTVADKFSQKA